MCRSQQQDIISTRRAASVLVALAALAVAASSEGQEPCEADPTSRWALFNGATETPAEALAAIVAQCKSQAVIHLTSELVRFQTVAAIAEPGENPAFQDTAEFLRQWAEARGLGFRVSGEHDAYELILAGQDRTVGAGVMMIAHIDVVPVNDPPSFVDADAVPEGWTVAPFTAVVRDERLWGRGTEDDKGPIAAAMIVMETMAEVGLVPARDVVLAMGTGEEHAWAGMRRYAEAASTPQYPISIDSSFPVTVGESGFVAWGLRVPVGDLGPAPWAPADVGGGLFLTQVPDTATLDLQVSAAAVSQSTQLVEEAVAAEMGRRSAAGEGRYTVEVEWRETGPHLTAHGESIHSAQADEGANALWLLAGVAGELELAPNGIAQMLTVIRNYFDGDHYGEKLGLAYRDDFMGRLLVAPTKLYVEDGWVVLEVNMRRPRGVDSDVFRAQLTEAAGRIAAETGFAVEELADAWVGGPHFVDPSGHMVQTLLGAYRAVAEDADAQPYSSRGSTYARLFEGAVSFGPSLAGRPYRGHGADEFIWLDALALQAEALALAVGRLALE